MNPMALMQLMQRWSVFQADHPKFVPFVNAVKDSVMKEGAILEMKVTDPDGKATTTNIKVTANDVETFRMIAELRKDPE